MAEVIAVCISEKKGVCKHEVPYIEVKLDHGIVGDHAAQITRFAIDRNGTRFLNPLRFQFTQRIERHDGFAELVAFACW